MNEPDVERYALFLWDVTGGILSLEKEISVD
jgi:hypothetical protein